MTTGSTRFSLHTITTPFLYYLSLCVLLFPSFSVFVQSICDALSCPSKRPYFPRPATPKNPVVARRYGYGNPLMGNRNATAGTRTCRPSPPPILCYAGNAGRGGHAARSHGYGCETDMLGCPWGKRTGTMLCVSLSRLLGLAYDCSSSSPYLPPWRTWHLDPSSLFQISDAASLLFISQAILRTCSLKCDWCSLRV